LNSSLQTAYSLGMQKITVANIGSTGCTPSELSTRSTSESCVSSMQDLIFNAALKPMTEELQAELPGSTIVYIKSFSIVMNIINNAASYSTTSFYCIQWPWILHFLPPTSHVKNLKWRFFQKLKIGMKHLFLISSLWIAQEIYKLLHLCYVCMWHVVVIC
jgi:hypothetical protein